MSDQLSRIAVELVACDYCAATPGTRCQTSTGRRATYTHGARTVGVREAYGYGYGEGGEDVLAVVDRWLRERLAHWDASAVDATLEDLAAYVRRFLP